MLGALPSFLRDPLALLRRAREMGDVSRLELGFLDAIMLHHPDHVDHVFRTHHRNYLKEGPFWDGVREVLGDGLPTSEGETWRRHRRMMQPQFHRQRITALSNLVIDALDESLSWSDVGPSWQTLEVGGRMPHLTMSVVAATIFGSSSSRQRSEMIANDAAFIANFTFKNPVVTVKPGTTVTWTNADDIPHTVVSKDGLFRSKVLAALAAVSGA